MPRTPAEQDSFAAFVRDQLQELGGVRLRRMFGGHGLYCRPTFFGILHNARLYFKTDDTTRHDYRAHGMEAFRPNAAQTLASYYEVPPEVLEDTETLIGWARGALAVARRAAASRTRSPGPVRSRR